MTPYDLGEVRRLVFDDEGPVHFSEAQEAAERKRRSVLREVSEEDMDTALRRKSVSKAKNKRGQCHGALLYLESIGSTRRVASKSVGSVFRVTAGTVERHAKKHASLMRRILAGEPVEFNRVGRPSVLLKEHVERIKRFLEESRPAHRIVGIRDLVELIDQDFGAKISTDTLNRRSRAMGSSVWLQSHRVQQDFQRPRGPPELLRRDQGKARRQACRNDNQP